MTAGRPAKSLAQKFQDGTFRADRANLNEPQPSPFDSTNPFCEETEHHGYKLWEFVVPELIDVYGIGKGDYTAVELYCLAYQRMKQAGDEIRVRGKLTIPKRRRKRSAIQDDDAMSEETEISADVKLEQQYLVIVGNIAEKLGLTPVSRRRVRGPKLGPLGIANIPMTLSGTARDRNSGPDDPPPPPVSTGDPLVDTLL